ncbi:MAG: hypothetical protein STHCBS139747_002775 [Sporothrix thermara]
MAKELNHKDGEPTAKGKEKLDLSMQQASSSNSTCSTPSRLTETADRDVPLPSVEVVTPSRQIVSVSASAQSTQDGQYRLNDSISYTDENPSSQSRMGSLGQESQSAESDTQANASAKSASKAPTDIYDRSTASITPSPMPRPPLPHNQTLPHHEQIYYTNPRTLGNPRNHSDHQLGYGTGLPYRGPNYGNAYGHGLSLSNGLSPSNMGSNNTYTWTRNSPQLGPFDNQHPNPLRQHPVSISQHGTYNSAYGVNNGQAYNGYRGVNNGVGGQSPTYGRGYNNGRVYGSPDAAVYSYGNGTHPNSAVPWANYQYHNQYQYHDTLAWNAPVWEDGSGHSQLRGIDPSPYPTFNGTIGANGNTGFFPVTGDNYNYNPGTGSNGVYNASSGSPAYGHRAATPQMQQNMASPSAGFRGHRRSDSRSSRSMTDPLSVRDYNRQPYGMGPPRADQLQVGRLYQGIYQRGSFSDLPGPVRTEATTPERNYTTTGGSTPIDPRIMPLVNALPQTPLTQSHLAEHVTLGSPFSNRAGTSAVGRVAATGIQGQTIAESESESGSDSDDSDATIRGPESTHRGKGKNDKKDNGDDGAGGASGASGASGTSGAGGSGAGADASGSGNSADSDNTSIGNGEPDNDFSSSGNGGRSTCDGARSNSYAPGSGITTNRDSQRRRKSMFSRVLRKCLKPSRSRSRSGRGPPPDSDPFVGSCEIISAHGLNEHAVQSMMQPDWGKKPSSILESPEPDEPATTATRSELLRDMTLVERNIVINYELSGHQPSPNPNVDVAQTVDGPSESVTNKTLDTAIPLSQGLSASHLEADIIGEASSSYVHEETAHDEDTAVQLVQTPQAPHNEQPGTAIAGPSGTDVERPVNVEDNVFDTAFGEHLAQSAAPVANQFPADLAQPFQQPAVHQHPPEFMVLTQSAEAGGATRAAIPGLRPGAQDVPWSQALDLSLRGDNIEAMTDIMNEIMDYATEDNTANDTYDMDEEDDSMDDADFGFIDNEDY